jgi:hypothetical protein
VYSTSKNAVTPIFVVDENGLGYAMQDDLEVIRKDGGGFEKVAIKGGARGVMNRREGQRSWWGSGMFGGEIRKLLILVEILAG